MILADVIGTVVVENSATWLEKPSYLLVQQVSAVGERLANKMVALDLIGAKRGERVLVSQGSSVRQTERTKDKPVDAVIAGIVDVVAKEGEEVFNKDK